MSNQKLIQGVIALLILLLGFGVGYLYARETKETPIIIEKASE
jgi:hypothetical protein